MEKIWMKSWQANIPRELNFRHGKMPLHEYLGFWARENPNKAAIIFYGREISYKELDEATDRFANYLIAQGLKKGDRVGLFLGNCPQYTIAHFGTQKMGGIVCPCSPLFKEMELEYELNDAGIEVLVAWDTLMPIVNNVVQRTGVKKVVVTNLNDYVPENPDIDLPDNMKFAKKPVPGTDDFMEIMSAGDAAPVNTDVELDEDIGLFQYTGGTTGLPKGAMLSYYSALFKTATVCQIAEINRNTVSLVTMPMFHIASMLLGMNSGIYSGATQVILSAFDAKTVMQAIQKYKIDCWYSAAPNNIALLAHPQAKDYDLTSLKLCLTSSFGIAMTEELGRQWGELTGGGVLVEAAYGLSETHTMDTYVPRDRIKYGTCGIPVFESDFKILDPTDRNKELPVGEAGELAVRTPAAFKGYWNKPEETKNTLIDGWVYTGDMCKFDEDGYLYLLGRKKEMIKVSGYSVFPEEVECYINKYPGVAQSAVIGVPDPRKGEAVKVFIVMQPGHTASADEIKEWAKNNMSYYKVPAHIEFLDKLPTLGTGKLLRRALKD